MRRRILVAIVSVTAIATTVLTVPLAVITFHRETDDAFRELQRASERTSAGLPDAPGVDGEPIRFPDIPSDIRIAVYSPDGAKIAGTGPETADAVTRRAARIAITRIVGTDRVLAHPVVVDGRKVAVVRVMEPAGEVDVRTRRAVLLLVVFDAVAIAVAALVGWFVAARLSRPVRELRDDAVRLGHGDFAVAPRRTGVSEIDETSTALAETAQRLEAMLSREREFSADASHQLRTPLAALRLSVETDLLDPRSDVDQVLEGVLTQIDRLDDTVTTLLAVARDRPGPRDRLDVDRFLRSVHARWDRAFTTANRTLTCRAEPGADVRVSLPVLDQIVDVLVGNAIEHGLGAVSVSLRSSPEGRLVLEVIDAGAIGRDPSQMFRRRDPSASGHGVGLNLARSLAEAEGGRLVLSSPAPTTFRLVLPGRDLSGPGPR